MLNIILVMLLVFIFIVGLYYMRFLRFIVILCLLSGSLFAFDLSTVSAYLTDYPIYVYGDVSYLEDTFNAISMIAGSAEAKYVIAAGIMWLAFTTGVQTVKAQGLGPAISNGTTAIVASTLLMLPNVTVHLIDNRVNKGTIIESTETYSKVSNVPYFIAVTGSVTTTLSSALIDISSAAFATLDPSLDSLTYSKLGLNGAFTVATDILKNTKLSRKTAMYVDDYTRLCVMQNLANNNSNDVFPVLLDNLKNPNGDWFVVNSPANLGITNLTFDAPDGSGITTCGDYFNLYVQPAVDNEKILQLDKLQARYPSIDLNTTKNAFQATLGMGQNFQNSVVNPLADLESFMVNYGASQAVMQTVATYGSNVNGLNLSNAINIDSAKAKLKVEGLGQWMWASTTIPNVMHFLTGIIYSASIFMLMLITWVGYEAGKNWLKNYALGLLMFESVRLSLQITNDAVNHYAAKQAVVKLASIGNVASIDGAMDYYDYISDMTGTAGQLGLTAALLIPSIIFGGKVMNAIGSLGALQGLMNSMAQNAQNTAVRQKAQNDMKNEFGKTAQELAADAAYMGEIDSYTSNLSKRHVNDSGNYGQYVAGSVNSADMQMGQRVGMGQAPGDYMGAGSGLGRQSALQSLGSGEAANRSLSTSSEMKAFEAGARNTAGKNIGGTIGAGRSEQSYDAIVNGAANSGQVATEADAVSGATKGDMLSDALRKASYYKGIDRNTHKDLATTEGIGKGKDPSKSDWDALSNQASGQFQESFSSAKGYNREATDGNGNITKARADAVENSTAAKIAGETEAITRKLAKGYNPAEMAKRAADVQSDSDIGAYNATLKNFIKHGNGVYEQMAYSQGLSSAAQAMAAIHQAGGSANLASLMGVSSAANISGLQGAIRGAHGAGNYITSQGYSAEKRSAEAYEGMEADLAGNIAERTKHGGIHLSGKGREAISTNATMNTTMLEKAAARKEQMRQQIAEGLNQKDGFDLEKTAASFGMTSDRLKEIVDKGGMTNREMAQIMANQEKKMEKSELYGVSSSGNTIAATYRTQYDLATGAVTAKFESMNSQQVDSYGYKFNADTASMAIHAAGGGHVAYGAYDGVKQVGGLVGAGKNIWEAGALAKNYYAQRLNGFNGSINQPSINNPTTMPTTQSSSSMATSSINSSLGMRAEAPTSRFGSIISEAGGFATKIGTGVMAMSFMPTSVGGSQRADGTYLDELPKSAGGYSGATLGALSQPTHIPTHVVQQGPITQQASLRTMEDMSMQIQRGNNFAVQQTSISHENKQLNVEMLATLKSLLKKGED